MNRKKAKNGMVLLGISKPATGIKAENNASIYFLLTILFVFIFLGGWQVLYAEQSPRLFCELMVSLMIETRGYIDDPKTDIIEISNLHRIPLKVLIAPLPKVRLEPLRLDPKGKIQDEGHTVEITVSKISIGKKEDVPVKLSHTGSVGNLKEESIGVNLEIPVEPEKKRKAVVEQLKRIEQSSEKEGRLQEFKALTQNKEAAIATLERMYMQNEAGKYEVTCKYKSHRPGFWNGEITSSPLPIEVIYKGEYFDQPSLRLP